MGMGELENYKYMGNVNKSSYEYTPGDKQPEDVISFQVPL